MNSRLFFVRHLLGVNRQNTICSSFAKDPRFLNMVITFVLHHLSHYNSITKPRARFLISFLERLTINFLSHFILSLIDVYRDTTTRDKLIFPSAIKRTLRHFFVSYLESLHFSVMCATNVATFRQSKAQLRTKRPWIETATPSTFFAPSTSAPFSLAGGVTLKVVTTHGCSPWHT